MASRDPEKMCPMLRHFWWRLSAWYIKKFPDRNLILTATYRTPKEQFSIFKRNRPGMILTKCDGYEKKSKHNYLPSHAFDVAVMAPQGAYGKVVVWEEEYYKPFAEAMAFLDPQGKFRWGGNFSFKDYPHFEVFWPRK